MRLFDSFGGPDMLPPDRGAEALRQVVIQTRLNRVLAFTRLTIDDVVNNPIAKNQVLGYYKLSKMIDRRGEIVELERQWNPVGGR
jgi:hypothetical protein